jgi:hypothetical protein
MNDSTERGFSLMNRKIHGAKEFKNIVQVKEDAKTWRKNLEKMNQGGIFLFDQSGARVADVLLCQLLREDRDGRKKIHAGFGEQ